MSWGLSEPLSAGSLVCKSIIMLSSKALSYQPSLKHVVFLSSFWLCCQTFWNWTPHINSVVCWPGSDAGRCPSALCGFWLRRADAEGFNGCHFWEKACCNPALSPQFLKHVSEESDPGCSVLTREESRDNMFWITRSCVGESEVVT